MTRICCTYRQSAADLVGCHNITDIFIFRRPGRVDGRGRQQELGRRRSGAVTGRRLTAPVPAPASAAARRPHHQVIQLASVGGIQLKQRENTSQPRRQMGCNIYSRSEQRQQHQLPNRNTPSQDFCCVRIFWIATWLNHNELSLFRSLSIAHLIITRFCLQCEQKLTMGFCCSVPLQSNRRFM